MREMVPIHDERCEQAYRVVVVMFAAVRATFVKGF
jgi:hypothetical protein